MTQTAATTHAARDTSRRIDWYAIACSALCIVHCLALPLLVAVIPAVALVAEAEWVHVALVLAAAPATLWVVSRAAIAGRAPFVVAAGLVGLTLLFVGAFVETEFEELLTSGGAALLIAAHTRHWLRQRTRGAEIPA